MKNILCLILGILSQFSCNISQRIIEQQGITGRTIWLEGNLMPVVGDTLNFDRTTGIPVQRTLLIYKAVKQEDTQLSKSPSFYSEVRGKLIKKIQTNVNGSFRVNLNPGKYSVFVKEEDGLFANIFDGKGFINPVTVEAGKFTDIVIKVNYKAAY